MDCIKRLMCFSKTRQAEEEWVASFLENGSKLLEGLLASSDGKYDVPYRNFTAKELIMATTNFEKLVMADGIGYFYVGSFQERSILVKSFRDRDGFWDQVSYTINDIVISLQMSHHRNVLKLLGCCLEFNIPAIVYEYSGNTRLLSDILHRSRDESSSKDDDGGSLSWKIRLKLAVDIANALVYLHSAFVTPIIHRDLCPRNIILCSDGVAKLLDFSLCISLPPGESQVEDSVVGSIGSSTLVEHVKDHVVNNQVDRIFDSILLAEKDGTEQEHRLKQMQAFTQLALRCTLPGIDRPDMISVAKELVQIKKSVHIR